MAGINKYFEILEISSDSSYEEAKAAYRELAHIYHPDKHMQNERVRLKAEIKYKKLNNAWSELEAYYKAIERQKLEQEAFEKQQREKQQREREEAVRAEAERKEQEEKKYVKYTCDHCGAVNRVPRVTPFESAQCGPCGKYLSREREYKEQLLKEECRIRNKQRDEESRSRMYEQAAQQRLKREEEEKRSEVKKFAIVIVLTSFIVLAIYAKSWFVKPELARIEQYEGSEPPTTEQIIDFNKSSKSLDATLKAANQGNSESQNNLGVMYFEGIGVAQDYSKAIKWFLKAANQGNADSQNNLGVMYFERIGVAQDFSEAIKWFLKAANQGNSESQNNLGHTYYNGYGVAQDYSEAVKWFLKAAKQGHAVSQRRLGLMYYTGKGVRKDRSEGLKWTLRAVKQGNAEAQLDYNIMVKERSQ